MSNGDTDIVRVVELAEQFTARRQRGESPTIQEYLDEFPELAPHIRELFPAVAMLGNAADYEETQGSTPTIELGDLPNRIGDYRILEEIGRGGMGVVYRAEQESLHRIVALKILPHAHSHSNALERFKLEAKSTAALEHPNIVRVHEVAQHEETWFYAMQYIQGSGLDELTRCMKQATDDFEKGSKGTSDADKSADRFKPAPSTAHGWLDDTDACLAQLCGADLVGRPGRAYHRNVAEIGADIANALSCAHRNGIIHRDIKPSNLLLDQQGKPWITDFGLVKTAGTELTETGQFVGTLSYMAPERFRGLCDARSDVYSLGATLYELLTLQRAFEAEERVTLIKRVLDGELESPRSIDSRIPKELEIIVLKAMEFEPHLRYQTAEELEADLRSYLDNRPIRARQPTWYDRTSRWIRRNPIVSSLMLGMVVALFAAFLGWAQASRDRNIALKMQEFGSRAIDRVFRVHTAHPDIPKGLRRELAEATIEYELELIELLGKEGTEDARLAESFRRVAYLSEAVGMHQKAEDAYLRRIDLLKKLVSENPDVDHWNIKLGATYCDIGATQLSLGRLQDAAKSLESSCSIQENYAETHTLARFYLAQAMGNQGLLLRRLGQQDRAIEVHTKELNLRKTTQSSGIEAPTNGDGIDRSHLARALLHLSNCQEDLGQIENTLATLIEADKVLLPNTPSGIDVLTAAVVQARIAEMYLLKGQFKKAIDRARRGDQLMDTFLRSLPISVPLSVVNGERVSLVKSVLAKALIENGQIGFAKEELKDAISINRRTASRTSQLSRLLILQAEIHRDYRGSQHAINLAQEAWRVLTTVKPNGWIDGRNIHVAQVRANALRCQARLILNAEDVPPKSAVDLLEEAITTRESLVAARPRMPLLLVELGRDVHVRAALHFKLGRLKEGNSDVAEAISIFQQVLKDSPHMHILHRDLAISHGLKGYYLMMDGQAKAAESAHRLSCREWNKFAPVSQPGDLKLAVRRGASLCNFSVQLLKKGEYDEAGQSVADALQVLEAVTAGDAESKNGFTFLLNALQLQTKLAARKGDHDSALGSLSRLCLLANTDDRIAPAKTWTFAAFAHTVLKYEVRPQSTDREDEYTDRIVQLLEAARDKGFFDDDSQRIADSRRQFRSIEGTKAYEEFLDSLDAK